MSTINAENSPTRETVLARSGPNTPTVKNKAESAAPNGRGASAKVELSDHAKAVLARAKEHQFVADQLEAYLESMRTDRSAQSEPESAGQPGEAMAELKKWAKMDVFRNAAKAIADDEVRGLVRDGHLPLLPRIDDEQWNQLSTEEQNVYGTVSVLQGLYDAMPKTLDQALSDHVNSILEGYPEDIERMKNGLASGALKAEDGWEGIIAQREAELAAAREGKMQIHAVDDPSLVQTTNEFSVSRGASFGWSGRGITVNGNFPNLYEAFGTKNVVPGSSPYTGDYVITW